MLRPVSGAKAAEKPQKKHFNLFAGVDRGLLISFIALVAGGLVVLYAASYYNAQDSGSPLSEVYSQLMGVAAGAMAMLLLLKIDYRELARPRISSLLLMASIVLLILVAIPGIGRALNGSRRWLRLGPVSFQPSELA